MAIFLATVDKELLAKVLLYFIFLNSLRLPVLQSPQHEGNKLSSKFKNYTMMLFLTISTKYKTESSIQSRQAKNK